MTRDSFHCGEAFFYWTEFEQSPYYDQNSNRMIKSGKYDNLQQELLSNGDNEIQRRNYNIMAAKSMELIKTQKVKAMKFWSHPTDWSSSYGIRNGSPIQLHHIQAVICYTDFSDLSTSFTKTLRRNNPLESLQSMKKRNSCYYWMSKYLVEAVEGYGDTPVNETLYCGMSCRLIMGSVSLYLNGSTSTTTALTISQNFATVDGLILEIDNPRASLQNELCVFRLNVSALSRYKEESERLFMHSKFPMELQSIRLAPDDIWIKWESYFKVLYYIDALCKGQAVIAENVTSEMQGIHSKIFTMLLNQHTSLPKYIRDCFSLMKSSKKSIKIWLNNEGIPDNIDYIINYVLHKRSGSTLYNPTSISSAKQRSNVNNTAIRPLIRHLNQISLSSNRSDSARDAQVSPARNQAEKVRVSREAQGSSIKQLSAMDVNPKKIQLSTTDQAIVFFK